MKFSLFIISIFLFSNNIFSQSKELDTLYIYQNNPTIFPKENRDLGIVFLTMSKDKGFKFDSFKFYISTFKNFDSHYNLNELVKKTKVDDIKRTKKFSTFEHMNGWDIHNMLSRFKKIYLVFDNVDNNFYNVVEMKYEGTQKDLNPSGGKL